APSGYPDDTAAGCRFGNPRNPKKMQLEQEQSRMRNAECKMRSFGNCDLAYSALRVPNSAFVSPLNRGLRWVVLLRRPCHLRCLLSLRLLRSLEERFYFVTLRQ